MDKRDMDPELAVGTSLTLPSATLMVVSVAMFLAAGPVTGLTKDAASSLTDTTAYVSAVLGGGEDGDGSGAVGVVLPDDGGGSGMLRPGPEHGTGDSTEGDDAR
jgi:multicomponent Na+:H+ antiporter subunit D